METKLCRICGKSGQNYIHIFKTEGLKNKIETCLPIIVSPHCLLPDTICGECSENVDNFYSFIKNCLQNIIILEAQYDITTESCLKTKRKHEKSTTTSDLYPTTHTHVNREIQTDDYLDVLLRTIDFTAPESIDNPKLVDYEIDSSSDSEDVQPQPSNHFNTNNNPLSFFNRRFFDDTENNLIDEITQRKCLKRRNCEEIMTSRPKIFKMDRRKTKVPKKIEPPVTFDVEIKPEPICDDPILPQVCLLCDEHFAGPSMLAAHVFETHGIDMAQIVAGELAEKKKKLPDLLKISDFNRKDAPDDVCGFLSEEPPTLLPSFVCSLCPAIFTSRPDLFTHLRVKHPESSSLLCGMCLYQASTLQNLTNHVENCSKHHQGAINNRYSCQICRYSDDSMKCLENHVLVHDFLIETCRKQSKMFDPSDYVDVNPDVMCQSPSVKNLTCTECQLDDFDSFKEFSAHRRSQHSIFHCDLCNKFYGRNSHLWKHVNRLHKGHPSITCQLCYKTSASKYHLAQHFNKIHNSSKQSNCTSKKSATNSADLLSNLMEDENFMTQKFQGFDFQSVKQSFMRQELLMKATEQNNHNHDNTMLLDDNSNNRLSDQETMATNNKPPPKEIDSSSDLYTNIITNYTPPVNEGEFKCPKCGKGFHKKTLVKKHKKNCRPRLQKDLLTRCKSCARIFKDRQSLAKHLVNYHSEYVCEICSQKVQSKCEIVSHIRFAHPGCHLFCQSCDNILRCQDDLDQHLIDHVNSSVCQFCGDSLPSKIKLKMHILSLHRKILSLSCGVCLKLFESQHVLRDHVRLVHRDQLAPLTSCTVCGKNYGSKWKTYDHLNKSHGRIFKACKVCLEVFDDDCQLQQHCDSSHPNVTVTPVVAMAKNQVSTSTMVTVINKSDSDPDQSESDDDDDDDDYYNRNDSVTAAFPEMQVAKLSLLEKRLLCKTLDDIKTSPTNNEDGNLMTGGGGSSPTNQQSNSSKRTRTVYVNSNDPSFCEICHKTWPAKKHLWQHYIRCHKSVAATVCGICLKTNATYECLQNHLRSTHPTLLHGQGFGSNFICRICGRYHNANSKLKLHMAIHEKFDWSLLERKHPNGYDDDGDDDVNGKMDDVINYESLIEQVECSSDSDEDNNTEVDEEEAKTDDRSSSDGESCVSAISLIETGMSKEDVTHGRVANNQSDYSSESSDGDDDDDDDDGDGDEFSVKSSDDDSSKSSVYRTKSAEIDSAVQSIKYEDDNDNDDDDEDDDEDELVDYCDLQSQAALNETEIESAVGSIL